MSLLFVFFGFGILAGLISGIYGGWLIRSRRLAKNLERREILLAVEVQRAQKSQSAPGTTFERRERFAEYLVLQGKRQEAGRIARELR